MTNEQILENAKYRYEKDNDAFAEQTVERRAFVFSAHPEIKTAFDAAESASSALLRACADGSSGGTIEALRVKYNLALSEQRSRLIEAGFAPDLLDFKPRCSLCRDTGYVNTAVCSCFEGYIQEERRRSISSLLVTGNESFDNFSLSFYPNEYSDHMATILEVARHFANDFEGASKNLYFFGAPGLGKTFLSACIARVVANKGFSVVYDGFISIMTVAEGYKFGRFGSLADYREQYEQYFDCDLLIIDDLGSEMSNSFTASVLYEIINGRLLSGKKTIISSNIDPDGLDERYGAKIHSRIWGEFVVMGFVGEDIRAQKKNM
ncbi:MAG: ATP-binding protein [Oscillospiraceae bacterium]|jgi:DNA replication protein DnaC|nr:ATP-binding protein [Oscillospiraceae bacterium]